MDTSLVGFIVLMSATSVLGQRPFFAGSKPIGFPETPNITTEGLADRFGEDGTTPKIPIEANGDWDLIDRLSKMPIDKQPFWFINWQAYEANRKNPQNYPQRPNSFIDPIPTTNNANIGTGNSNSAASNSNAALPSNSDSGANLNAASISNTGSTANRFGEANSDSKVKPNTPASASAVNKKEVSSSEVKSTTANYGTTSNYDSGLGSKFEQVRPLVPSLVVPPTTDDKTTSVRADPSEKKLSRQYRRF